MAAGSAIASVAVGGYNAYNSNKNAKAALKAVNRASAQDLAFRQSLWDDWQTNYQPLAQGLVEKANAEGPMNLGPAWANIQGNYDQAGRNLELSNARAGMTGSGLDASGRAVLEASRAGALGDAWQKGINSRDALRLQMAQFGKTVPQAATLMAQGYTNKGNLANQQLANANASASDAWGAVGSGLSSLGQAWQKYGGVGMFGLGSGDTSTTSPQIAAYEPGTATLTQARNVEKTLEQSNPYAEIWNSSMPVYDGMIVRS